MAYKDIHAWQIVRSLPADDGAVLKFLLKMKDGRQFVGNTLPRTAKQIAAALQRTEPI